MTNKDCFAYRSDRYCAALNEVVCKSRECNFYKSRRRYLEDLKKYPPINYQLYKDNGIKEYLKGCG